MVKSQEFRKQCGLERVRWAAAALLWLAAACDTESDVDAAMPATDASLDGAGFDGGVDAATEASADGDDAATGYPATQQTGFASCDGEALTWDYPSVITVTGLNVPDGTDVWGFIGFSVSSEGFDHCSVRARTEVQDGSFRLEVTATSNGGYFPDVAFFIDADGDGGCGATETVFRDTTSGGSRNGLTLELTAAQLADDFENPDAVDGCEPFVVTL